MDAHLRMAGYLNIALAIFGVVVTALALLIFRGPQGILLINARQGSSVSTFEGIVTAAFLVFWLIMAAPLISVGIGLLRADQNARDLATILSIIEMLLVPAGTIVGLYTLWVVTSHEVEPLFRQRRTKRLEE